MEEASINSTNPKVNANRSWGLIVLKTAYRDRYPKVTADVISENSEKVEKKLFEKASSTNDYDESVLKAYNTITTHGTSRKNLDTSSTADSRKSNAGRTPRCPSGTNTSNQQGKTVAPMSSTFGRPKMTKRIQSLTPIAKEARKQMPTSTESKIAVDDTPGFENLDFFGTKRDASDVIMLVPFILEAGVQVIGEIKTVVQTQSITESQKSSIGLLGIEKMFRALYLSSGDSGINNGSPTSTQPSSEPDQEQILYRAKQLRKKYVNEIRTIYAKLGELFDTSACDKKMILDLTSSLHLLEEVERSIDRVSRQTVHILNYVENVFKSAIEQYGYLLRATHLPHEDFRSWQKADSGKWAGTSSISTGRSPHLDDITYRGSRRNGSRGGYDDDFGRLRSHYDKTSDADNGMANLKQKYRDKIKALVPLVRAELANQVDAKKIREQMCYVTAFLNLDNVTDEELVRRTEKTIQEFYERFRHLLPGKSSEAQLSEERILPQTVALKTAPHSMPQSMRPAKVTAYGSMSAQQVIENMVYETEEFDEESEEDATFWEDWFHEEETEKLRTKPDASEDEEHSKTKEGQKQKFKSNSTCEGNEKAECEFNEGDEASGDRDDVEERKDVSVVRKDAKAELPDTDERKTGETDGRTADEEDNAVGKQEEQAERSPKEDRSAKVEEAKAREENKKTRTPRRSHRISVIAARTRGSTVGGKGSHTASGTVRTSTRSKPAKQASTPARTRTPGKGLRPLKTPRKD